MAKAEGFRQKLRDGLPLLSFAASMLLIAFAYGVIVGTYKVFPYRTLAEAKTAAAELWSWAEVQGGENIKDHPHIIAEATSGGKRLGRYDAARAHAGLTLVEAYTYDQFALLLVDMSGMVVHRWNVPDAVYQQLEGEAWSLKRGHYEIMGSHLYPNGDVLLTLSFRGLARLDRCGGLEWFLEEGNHHSVVVEEDGTIWSLARDTVTDERAAPPHFAVPYRDDKVQRITPDGEVIEEINIIDAIFAGGYEGVVLQGSQDRPESITSDPTHANNIEIVSPSFAQDHAFASAGDILVSLRTSDSIVLIDRKSHQVKWALTGMFLRQHDPDLHPDGSITVFDNRTDTGQHNQIVHLTEPQAFGYSRVIRLDPVTQVVLWKYEGTPDEPFYTSIQGDHQVLPNGNVMIVETEAGRVFEVDPVDNAVVWEWFNIVDGLKRDDVVGRVTAATRYPEDYPTFVGQDCPR